MSLGWKMGMGLMLRVVCCGSVRIAATRIFGSPTGIHTRRCFHLQPCTSSHQPCSVRRNNMSFSILRSGNIFEVTEVGPFEVGDKYAALLRSRCQFQLSLPSVPAQGMPALIRRRFIAPSRKRSSGKSSLEICNNSKDTPGQRSRQQCLILQRQNWLKTVSRSAGTTFTG
jgi:hypothetical protein